MKKNIEWLKDEVKSLFDGAYDLGKMEYYESEESIHRINSLIDQLDEPEVTLDKAFEKIAESYLMTKEEIWRHLERLEACGGKVTYDELEILSQQWIDENKVEIARINNLRKMTTSDVVRVEKLKNLLVPKQHKPVIPQFAADFIEKWKNEGLTMSEWFEFNYDDEDEDKVSKWLYDNDYEENRKREHLLIDAIRYGYEAKKEQKYEVKDKHGCFILIKNLDGEIINAYGKVVYEKSKQLTEQEIKDYDKRYWVFAEEAKE